MKDRLIEKREHVLATVQPSIDGVYVDAKELELSPKRARKLAKMIRRAAAAAEGMAHGAKVEAF